MPWPLDFIVLLLSLEVAAFLAFGSVIANEERRRKGKP